MFRPLTHATVVVVAVLATSAFLAVESKVRAQSPDNAVTINGRVVNGSGNELVVDGLAAFALIINEETESIIGRVESTIDEDGSFSLGVPNIDDGSFYRIVVDDGMYTPYVDLLRDQIDDVVTLTVYDRTTSLDAISVTSVSMVIPVIDEGSQTIGVLAAINLVNEGDEIYLADLTDPELTGFNLLRFNLPEGYQELSVESDLPSGNVMEISTGFALSNPVPPGEYSLIASYSVSYRDGILTYPLRLPFGAGSVSIFLPEGIGTISGLGLTRGEEVEISGKNYVRYEGLNYERREELNVEISGLPLPGIQSQLQDFFGSTQFRVAIIATSLIAIGAAVIYYRLVISRSPQTFAQSATGDARNATGTSSETLLAEIAELDESYDLGKVEDGDYTRRRRELMAQVIEATSNNEST